MQKKKLCDGYRHSLFNGLDEAVDAVKMAEASNNEEDITNAYKMVDAVINLSKCITLALNACSKVMFLATIFPPPPIPTPIYFGFLVIVVIGATVMQDH